ncbi:RING/U-box superfamily protein [Rhynchospora pubera]|uniref:RING-type E3 ubiquitin transferase n=1 Tax=Rhynchospora pubera TaxID=906938 RepID=A0AAV8HS73_9POAL|nr:RING/U-box superfamily protein [Rhynchospora pubera]
MDQRLISKPTHLLLLLLLLLLHGSLATLAQNVGPPPTHYTGGFTTATAAIFGTLIVVFFCIALFSLCFYQRNYGHDIATMRPTIPTTSGEPRQGHVQKGVDHSVLETFPIMEYAAVKKLSTVRGPLECAVCLSEFADDESLRLLPGCCHVFHPDCIDQWLGNHITCPVCRADLSNPVVTIDGAEVPSETTGTGEGTTECHVVIQDDASGEPSVVIHTVDRFTLRLPPHMIKEIEEARKYRRSVSIAGYAYDRRGSTNGRSGRFMGFVRSFSSVLRREPDAESRSFKRVFALSDVAEAPMNSRSIGSSTSGESQGQRLSNVSELALLDRV